MSSTSIGACMTSNMSMTRVNSPRRGKGRQFTSMSINIRRIWRSWCRKAEDDGSQADLGDDDARAGGGQKSEEGRRGNI